MRYLKYPFPAARIRFEAATPFNYQPAEGLYDRSIHRKMESGCTCHCHVFGDIGCSSCVLYHTPPALHSTALAHTEPLDGSDVVYGREVPDYGYDFTNDIAEDVSDTMIPDSGHRKIVALHSNIGHMT